MIAQADLLALHAEAVHALKRHDRGEIALSVEVVLTDGPKIQIEHVGDVGDPGEEACLCTESVTKTAECPACLGIGCVSGECVDLTEDEQADAHDLATDLRIQRQEEYDANAEYAADRHADQHRDDRNTP